MSMFTKADYDLINLGVCIKNQADRLGIEHEGVPLEGVVVRIAERVLAEQGEPTDVQVEYRARAAAGHVYGDARITPEFAVVAYEEALDRETFEQDDETPVVEMRRVGLWLPVEQGDAS